MSSIFDNIKTDVKGGAALMCVQQQQQQHHKLNNSNNAITTTQTTTLITQQIGAPVVYSGTAATLLTSVSDTTSSKSVSLSENHLMHETSLCAVTATKALNDTTTAANTSSSIYTPVATQTISTNNRDDSIQLESSSSNTSKLQATKPNCLSSYLTPLHANNASKALSNNSSTCLMNNVAVAAVSVGDVGTTPAQMLLNGIINNCVNGLNNPNQIISEDPRTLQLALELSMVGLNDEQERIIVAPTAMQQHYQNVQQYQHAQQQQQQHSLHQSTHNLPQDKYDLNTFETVTTAINVRNNMSSAIVNNSSNVNQFTTKNAATSSGMLPAAIEDRSKKSQNMTECVPVPSSEHVAEIVGRQGCKIKALRAKTNTYIKTPVRGEEPVFVVTGRKEDVAKAKREIVSAAEHFSLIRATRKPSIDGNINICGGSAAGTGGSGKTPPVPPSLPGQVTIQVRVPYRVVGLVVGPKGATIKHIQQETQTYIVTPSREKEPIFEVTGLPDNVQSARKQIEAHIALRTGNLPTVSSASSVVDVTSVHTINALNQILSDDINTEFLTSLYKNGICSAFEYLENGSSQNETAAKDVVFHHNVAETGINLAAIVESNTTNQLLMNSVGSYNNFVNKSKSNNGDNLQAVITNCNVGNDVPHQHAHSTYIPSGHITYNNLNSSINAINLAAGNTGHTILANGINTNGITRSCSSASSTTSSKSAHNSGSGSSSHSSRPELINIWKNLGDSIDVDEGIGESPSIWTLPTQLIALHSSHCSPSTSISPTDSLLGELNSTQALNGINNLVTTRDSVLASSISNKKSSVLLQEHQLTTSRSNVASITRRECLVCSDREVTTALVPCGHNMFCMDCANRICLSDDSVCPVCSLTVYHAMRILA